MKLEFEQGFIPEPVYKELDFESYLSLFRTNLQIVPRLILSPLTSGEARHHFNEMNHFEAILKDSKTDPGALLNISEALPLLEDILDIFKDGRLQPFHLFELGTFVTTDLELQAKETSIPVSQHGGRCNPIRRILEKYTDRDFSALRLNDAEENLKQKLDELEERLQHEISGIEKSVFKQTGLKMIYPFPREVEQGSEELEKAKTCSHLTITDSGEFMKLEIMLDSRAKSLRAEKESLEGKWSDSMQAKLEQLNNELQPHHAAFSEHYEKRKKRALAYLFLKTRRDHSLVFPDISARDLCRVNKGILPSLKKEREEQYVPLDIEMKKGSTVIIGANLMGKTTVLKTLFFLLSLTKVGLPVPAADICCEFPESVQLHLKSSGNLERGLSGFTDELDFFCRENPVPSYFLVDELFQSTDPVSGITLSKIFIEEFIRRNSFFLCTSHYRDVLKVREATFFRMQDPEIDDLIDAAEDFQQKVPYRLEPIAEEKLEEAYQDNQWPLRVALRYPLSDSIIQRIKKELKP